MVTEVEMTVWILVVLKKKDKDVVEAHGKSERVYSKGGVLHHLFIHSFTIQC